MLIQVFKYISIAIFFVYRFLGGENFLNPEVKIPQGTLKGRIRTNADGGVFYSFQSIPYGKPPLGELRFKAPEPADGWNGTRDGTVDLPTCVQVGNNGTIGQEDCLYLNVYTPHLPEGNDTLKPVMVFIHGGGFVMDTASEHLFGAQFLLTKDIVLVVFNYRLNMFGFLSLDDPNLGVTGNAGLKDQVLAMKWVHKNINYFGGDPNNVLLFGQSAGSISVHFHILFSQSLGLFHKAIMQSGVSLSDATMAEFRNNGEIIAKALGIQTLNWSDMLQSLQEASIEEIATKSNEISKVHENFCRPIIEIPASNIFMQEKPIDVIKSGKYKHVPYMIGFNSADGLVFRDRIRPTPGKNILITDFIKFIPRDFKIQAGSRKEIIISKKIKEFYYGESNQDNITAAVNLNADFVFGFPAVRAALEHVNNTRNPIYFYYFNLDTELNVYKLRDINTSKYPGAGHSDELVYLFNTVMTPPIKMGSIEEILLKTMVNLWTNFAIYNNPTPDAFRTFKWQPMKLDQFKYLQLDNENIFMNNDMPILNRMKFWLELYREYYSN